MENYINSPLFHHISRHHIPTFCASFPQKIFERGEYIFLEGDQPEAFGVVIEGEVIIESSDYEGNRTILGKMTEGHIFAESYVLAREPMEVSVKCERRAKIIFIPVNEIYQANTSEINQFRNNLMALLASKNLNLSKKIFVTSPKTIRKKILAYLQVEERKNNSRAFEIPYNRQQMADYLGVDRSALSRELSSLKEEGFVDYHKNSFTLKK